MDAPFSSGHMEHSACGDSGYRTGNADARSHMDVCYEPEQHQHLYRNLVHSRGNLLEETHINRDVHESDQTVFTTLAKILPVPEFPVFQSEALFCPKNKVVPFHLRSG